MTKIPFETIYAKAAKLPYKSVTETMKIKITVTVAIRYAQHISLLVCSSRAS